jgi:hypothetical protein
LIVIYIHVASIVGDETWLVFSRGVSRVTLGLLI